MYDAYLKSIPNLTRIKNILGLKHLSVRFSRLSKLGLIVPHSSQPRYLLSLLIMTFKENSAVRYVYLHLSKLHLQGLGNGPVRINID